MPLCENNPIADNFMFFLFFCATRKTFKLILIIAVCKKKTTPTFYFKLELRLRNSQEWNKFCTHINNIHIKYMEYSVIAICCDLACKFSCGCRQLFFFVPSSKISRTGFLKRRTSHRFQTQRSPFDLSWINLNGSMRSRPSDWCLGVAASKTQQLQEKRWQNPNSLHLL